MGGVYVEELEENVTHLITDSVISNKYEVNKSFKLFSNKKTLVFFEHEFLI